MQSASIDNIKRDVLGYFSEEDISKAKDNLWDKCGPEIIGDKPRRKGSSVRSSGEAYLCDILSALVKLDKADKTPLIVISAYSLGAIPRSHPEELNNISLLDRLNQMEQRMSNMQTTIDNVVAQNLMLQDQVKDATSYAAKVKSPVTNSSEALKGLQLTHSDNNTGHKKKSSVKQSNLDVVPKQKDVQNKNNVPESTISLGGNTDADGFQIPAHILRRQRKETKQKQKVISGSYSTHSKYVEHQSLAETYLFTELTQARPKLT